MGSGTERLLAFVLLAALHGCVGGSKGISAEDRERLKGYIVETVPESARRIDVNFENKMHLVGYRAEPESAPPGTEVKLTYYWRCDEPLEDGWNLFTHVQHEGFDRPDNADMSGALREYKDGRQVLGPSRWEKGKIYVDEQTYRMPQELKGPESIVYVGLWKGDARLRVISGPTDGENRAAVVKLKTGVAPAPPKRGANDLPELSAKKLAAGEKIVVDGKGDEPAWRAAASTGPFVDVGSGNPGPGSPGGQAKLAWDSDNLYVLFEVTDVNVVGGFTDAKAQPKEHTVTGQPMLWTKHTVEMMVDPDGDGDNVNYYELQINPQNKIFKSQFDGYNAPKGGDFGPFGHEDWDPKLRSAVVVRGSMDRESDKDEGYTVEVQIPWSAYHKGAKTLPPKSGDTWRMNFYAMVNNGGVAWSPILGQGNFHKATRFGRVRWVVPGAPEKK